MTLSLTRRQALLAGAATLLAGPARAAAPDDWGAAFRAALKEAPWLVGYVSAPPQLDCAELTIEGRWPVELAGTFYRNGPARHDVGELRYHHWFDGDGMIQAFRIADGRVAHRGRMVQTDKYRREIAAGRALERTFGTALPELAPPTSAAAVNVANINVISHAGRLMALWEAADAYGIDPRTLDTQGPVVWRDDLRGMPFSAHPRQEPDGTLWSFGYAPQADLLVLYHIGADGTLKAAKALPVPDVGMVHDFMVTERHLVFLLPPISYDRDKVKAGLAFVDCYVWRPDQPARVLVVDKNTLAITRRHELPACFVFHYGNAFEEADGTIRFDCVRHPDPRVMTETTRYVMRGESRPSPATATMLVRLDPSGTTQTQMLAGGVEFPRIDPRRIGRRHARVWSVLLESLVGAPSGGVIRWDLENGTSDVHRFGPQIQVEEHVYVPRSGGAEGEGWLLGTHLDARAGVTRLAVFDALKLAAGPLAVASLPYPLPLGLHGSFVPA
ncbi:MAG TPA: carotenoid oxygenase family protein [Vineibacter sp.]|nr:carotenoid oxygenase family protein [Vineibacter sp.]